MSNLESRKSTLVIPLMIIGVVFFMIGFGVGISGFLTPALRSAFNLTTGQSYLVTGAIFSAFVIFGRPTGWVIKKIGYRKAMTIAFFIMALGYVTLRPLIKSGKFPTVSDSTLRGRYREHPSSRSCESLHNHCWTRRDCSRTYESDGYYE